MHTSSVAHGYESYLAHGMHTYAILDRQNTRQASMDLSIALVRYIRQAGQKADSKGLY